MASDKRLTMRCSGRRRPATATANLDNDDTLDQWHVNDSQRRPVQDVNDRKS